MGGISQKGKPMYCLTCELEAPQTGPECPGCGAPWGDPAGGWGFLPQLRHLEQGLVDGSISEEEADTRLNRMEMALQKMLTQIQQAAQRFEQTNLEDSQLTMVGSVLKPLHGSLEAQIEVAQQLPTEAPWPEEAWKRLGAAQHATALGYRAMSLLSDMIVEKKDGL